MSADVCISSMMSNHAIFDKSGLRSKYFDEDWEPARHEKGVPSDQVMDAIERYSKGLALQRHEMVEAAAVFDGACFKRTHDLFAAGGFFLAKARLAEVLSRFDLSPGGLVPFSIYQADLVTPYPGEFFLLNFGAQDVRFLPDQSKNVEKFFVNRETGRQIWDVSSGINDGDVVLSPAASTGADLWFDPTVYAKIFLSDSLSQVLRDAGYAEDWRLRRCRIAKMDC